MGSDPRFRSERERGVTEGVRTWWMRHGTFAGAVVVTVLFGWMVFAGRLPFDRSVGPVVFSWMLALHALGNRQSSERYERAVTTGLVGLSKAGIAYRLGKRGEAAQDVSDALREASQEIRTGGGATGGSGLARIREGESAS